MPPAAHRVGAIDRVWYVPDWLSAAEAAAVEAQLAASDESAWTQMPRRSDAAAGEAMPSPGNLTGLPLCEPGSLAGAWVSASAATSPLPPCCGNIGYGFPLQRHLPQLFPNYLSDSTSN